MRATKVRVPEDPRAPRTQDRARRSGNVKSSLAIWRRTRWLFAPTAIPPKFGLTVSMHNFEMKQPSYASQPAILGALPAVAQVAPTGFRAQVSPLTLRDLFTPACEHLPQYIKPLGPAINEVILAPDGLSASVP